MKFQIEVIKSKIHRVTVTQADLNYVGSITIDEALMEAANVIEGEKVQIMDINNGERKKPMSSRANAQAAVSASTAPPHAKYRWATSSSSHPMR